MRDHSQPPHVCSIDPISAVISAITDWCNWSSFDASNNRLGINKAAPSANIDVGVGR